MCVSLYTSNKVYGVNDKLFEIFFENYRKLRIQSFTKLLITLLNKTEGLKECVFLGVYVT